MPLPELLNQAQGLAGQATAKAAEYSDWFEAARAFILDHFGQPGLIAAYITGGALLLFVISRVAKLGLSTLKYLVVPAVALAFVATYFLPLSFMAALPVTATICSVFLLIKG